MKMSLRLMEQAPEAGEETRVPELVSLVGQEDRFVITKLIKTRPPLEIELRSLAGDVTKQSFMGVYREPDRLGTGKVAFAADKSYHVDADLRIVCLTLSTCRQVQHLGDARAALE
jgi:hypothetical protein